MDAVSVTLSIITGVALAAAAGLRVFVPLLATGIAIHFGLIEPAAGFAWLGEPVALAALGAATLLEIAGYYLPGVDHLLDVVAAPLAFAAGVVVAASVMADIPAWLRWLAAVIAGGGATAAVYSASSLTRATSATTTGGLGNPVVSTGELAGSIVLASLAILAPLLAAAALLALAIVLVRRRRARAR